MKINATRDAMLLIRDALHLDAGGLVDYLALERFRDVADLAIGVPAPGSFGRPRV